MSSHQCLKVSVQDHARRCKLPHCTCTQLTCMCSQSCAQLALPPAGPVEGAAAALPADTRLHWAQIWNRVKAEVPDAGEGLNPAQFACALRLVAIAQNQGVLRLGVPPWQEISGLPVPLPRLASQPRRSGLSTCAYCLQLLTEAPARLPAENKCPPINDFACTLPGLLLAACFQRATQLLRMAGWGRKRR